MKDNETLRLVLIAIAVVIFFGGFGMMRTWGYGFPWMGMMYGYGFYGLASLFNLAYKILAVVALVFVVVWLWQKIREKK